MSNYNTNDFPVYLDYSQNIERNSYTKYIDIINFYRQLYSKTDQYRCDKDVVNLMIMIADLVYIYNDEKLIDSDIILDKAKALYFKDYKYVYDTMPKTLAGYKEPKRNSDNRLDDSHIYKPVIIYNDSMKLLDKIDSGLYNLLMEIFITFGGFTYQELLPIISDMRIFKENSSINLYIKNISGNIYHGGDLLKIVSNEEIKNSLLGSNNFIAQFITNYDFSSIKANCKLNSINSDKSSKVKSFIYSATSSCE